VEADRQSEGTRALPKMTSEATFGKGGFRARCFVALATSLRRFSPCRKTELRNSASAEALTANGADLVRSDRRQ
jgi:hypothetical protein